MNNEIKEILEKLKKVANRETASRNALMEMKDTDYQLLLDYITNLQQENERLKETLEVKSYCKYANKCNEIYDCSKEEYNDMVESQIRLVNRINDAIEYIEDKMEINKECPQDLLNILNGRSNV